MSLIQFDFQHSPASILLPILNRLNKDEADINIHRERSAIAASTIIILIYTTCIYALNLFTLILYKFTNNKPF